MKKYDVMEGQMSITDCYPDLDRLVAVSRIFARARQEMTLAEQKTFIYALSKMRFKGNSDEQDCYVKLDKKSLAAALGITADPDHLSENMYRMIKELPKHSYVEFEDSDKEMYDSGVVITRLTMFRNIVRLKFERDYLGLFTGLTSDYITMWSSDIFQMTSVRSVQFYEYLRQLTDSRKSENEVGLGIRAIKEMFGIPETGKGSYMRSDSSGGFNRSEFEKKVIDPLCEDLRSCKMITLVAHPDGKLYEKVKHGNRVSGYLFRWVYTSHPGVASAGEVSALQDRVDKNPEILKVAKDIVKGEKKKRPADRSFGFQQHDYNFEELEKELTEN